MSVLALSAVLPCGSMICFTGNTLLAPATKLDFSLPAPVTQARRVEQDM